MSTNKLCANQFEPSTSPPPPPIPSGYPRYSTVYLTQGVGNLIQVFGLVEFMRGFLCGFLRVKEFSKDRISPL